MINFGASYLSRILNPVKWSMVKSQREREAPGWPGNDPRWARGNKDGVGTAYSADSRVWFTVWRGTLTEAYYPTIDKPQLRDLEYLITDEETFFHEEKRHLDSKSTRLSHDALGYRLLNSDPDGRYVLRKEIISDPHLPCILQHTHVQAEEKHLNRMKLYVLCAPHLGGGGAGNNAHVVEIAGHKILAAEKEGTWLALGATVPFLRLSCGYVGRSDGWTDLAENMKMDWEFDIALNGNVALMGQLDLTKSVDFTLGLAFGSSFHNAATALFQSLSIPFQDQRKKYVRQWARPCSGILPLERFSQDKGNLFHASYCLILSHEDKSYPGAIIASLSIPWGESKGDEDKGGYHLVWTRDLVQCATALLAAGNTETPLRTLVYLATSQQDDGGFAQNFWLDGGAYSSAVQLDEVSFPIILAWRLWRANALQTFDPYLMVINGASFLVRHGPATQQERWEEASGYSPSTLASNVAALICAADFARSRGETQTAGYLEEYADFLESHIESWTATTEGTLLPEIKRHYIRINPVEVNDPHPLEDPNTGVLKLANTPPGSPATFPAKDIVDAGFLELVRYGIRSPHDPMIIDSLRVVDALLKIDTPWGPCWHRYNRDGYGQREDGGPFQGWGKGRAWPLLTGERGHYEIAAGRGANSFVRAMEGFASSAGLLPEQVWDEPDTKELHLRFGLPTGSAMPLMWAHAEYVKLLRSASEGKVFDTIPIVAERYLGKENSQNSLEIWKPNRQPRMVRRGVTLRVQAERAFRLHWSSDDWRTIVDTPSSSTNLGIEFVNVKISSNQEGPIRFTFFWTETGRWEGRDYSVAVCGDTKEGAKGKQSS